MILMLASFTLKRQQPQPQTLIYCTYHRIQLLLGMSFIFLCFWGALPASLVALGMVLLKVLGVALKCVRTGEVTS